ncbi:uncharacterized protein [Bemisia tabaci]|uniref:uncharacterized protein isoform X2 n=1 Tax=Bemisia tabaci TaxID=7038 RepID=UPI003B28338D
MVDLARIRTLALLFLKSKFPDVVHLIIRETGCRMEFKIASESKGSGKIPQCPRKQVKRKRW